ncbi:hypothetical protein DFH07DRAFT_974105 [Mycena maculata]|uniref:Uncharacterized protein n=1 Tax=Mycena maculata TaxID=230809 RepID=A0AAD7H9K8_9AGAR|nr:hypothetical protein DFH07DRAFT_974105 [Mycena maculata]
MSDHPGIAWTANSTQTLESVTQNATAFNEAYEQWNRSHTGPFVDLGTTDIGWFRLDPDSPIFENFTDPSAGPDTAHIELVFSVSWDSLATAPLPSHQAILCLYIGLTVVTLVSRGSVTLQSSNSLDPPLIGPSYMTSEFDLFAAGEGHARKIFTAPVQWSDYIIAPLVDLANFTTDAQHHGEHVAHCWHCCDVGVECHMES